MPKPWAKTEIGYTDHPKFLALNANAFALWHEAKDWCEKHHTDGLIPREAVKRFRYGGKKSVSMLSTLRVEKADGTLYAPLWEEHTVGFKMHDYLDHNDCRDTVLARIEKADERRETERERKAEWRAKKKDKAEMSHGTNHGTHSGTVPSVVPPPETPLSRSTTTTTTATNKDQVSAERKPPAPVTRFLTLYEELFERAHGRKPVITKREPGIAKQIITKVGEESALALLRAFFESDDPWILDAGHGLNVFTSQANKLLSSRKAKPVVPTETPDEYLERIGWCSHEPKCTDSDVCRAKRAETRAVQAAR